MPCIHFICFLKAAFDHPCMTRVGEEVTCRMMTHTRLSLQGHETVLIIIYTHIYLSLSLPTTHKIHLKLLIFHSQRTRCQEDECRNRERERAMYVWCDHLLRAACAHLNTPFSHWTNEADGSTVACQENYTIITGFSNISPPHAAPSLALSLPLSTSFPHHPVPWFTLTC